VGCRFGLYNNASGTIYGVRAPVSDVTGRPVIVHRVHLCVPGSAGTRESVRQRYIQRRILETGNDFWQGWNEGL